MIYNSNGDNTPYQTGGNAKVNKQLKELREAIDSVNDGFNDFLGKIDLYTGEDFIHGYSEQNRFTDNTGRVKALEATVNGNVDLGVKSLDQKILDVDDKVTALGTEVNTVDLTATNGDFHKVVAGKYVFQNGYSITGTSICKINNGSVVYATDGTNSVLIDYTDKDAWVAKAKVEDGEHFSIYSNGVLAFTQSGGWSVYVIGNDFDTDDLSIPEETPVNIETGVTIGGNLYAALGREYDFDSITSDEASIRIATITGNISAPNADIDKIDSDEITVADLTATDADIESLNNSKRNFKGYKAISTHQTNLVQFIRIPRFTGTYNLRLVKNINGADTDLFTATIIWNGHDPIVQYKEYSDNEALDYLYSIILTEHNLYFVTQGDGRLYYGWDAFDAQEPDNSLVFPFVASIPSNILAEGLRAEYITKFHNRTVFFGNHTNASGIDVLGQITADELSGPGKKDINYRGKTTVANLATLDAEPGDIYTVTDEGYTTNRFVEGAGKPINAGDDVMMVEVTEEPSLERIEGITELVRSSIATDDGAILLFPQRENGIGDAPTVQKIYKYDGNTLTDVDVTVDDFWSYGFYSNPIKTPTGRIIVFNYGGNGIPGEQRQPIAIYSDDNGATWGVSYTTGDYTYVGVNLASAATVAQDGTIYVTGNLGFQKSTDNGTTFARVVSEDENPIYPQMILALQDGSLLAASDAPGGGKSLYKSTNAGLNWSQIYTRGRIDYLYQFSNGIITIGPKYSTDNGETWQEINGQYPFGPSFVELDNLIYSGDGLRSTNGASWESYVAIPDNYSWVAELDDSTLVYSGAIYDEDTNYYFPAKYNIKPVKTLKWDKFAAGVNYENFVAQNIKATGNLEVDGTSQFDDDVTLDGDLTQTGDQNITGEVVISEKETINNKEPTADGHYKTTRVWKINNTFITNSGNPIFPNDTHVIETTEPGGTSEDSGSYVSDDVYCTQENGGLPLYRTTDVNDGLWIEKNGLRRCDENGDWISAQIENPRDESLGTSSMNSTEYYLSNNTVLGVNKLYYYSSGSQKYMEVYGTYRDHFLTREVTDQTKINELENKRQSSQFGRIYTYPHYSKRYEKVNALYSNSVTYLNTEPPAVSETLYGPFRVKVFDYREFVYESDPSHTYNASDEVLTVKGNENITRDLQVEGYIFQKPNKRAVLADVEAAKLNVSNNATISGVVTIGDLD